MEANEEYKFTETQQSNPVGLVWVLYNTYAILTKKGVGLENPHHRILAASFR